MVSHPPHYTSHPSGIECIQVTEHMNFNLGNATKYIWRAGLKSGDAVEDLRKAAFYVDREIARLGGESDGGVPESDVPDKIVYEFFGRVSNVQFESTMDTTEVDLTLTPTMMSGATHRIRFEISPDDGGNVADLFFGKSAQPIVPEPWTKAVMGAYDTGGFLKSGATKTVTSSGPKYADGDKVTITEASPGYPDKDWFGFNLGDVCEFVRDGDWDGEPGYSILVRSGNEQSVPNTHFARSEPVDLFRVGDRVRVIKKPSMTGAEPVGAIGKIQAGPDSDGDYEVKFEDDWHYFEPAEIEAATEPKVGDILTITKPEGHSFPIGSQVQIDRPGTWGGEFRNIYAVCSRVDGKPAANGMAQQSILLTETDW